jgi:hypothetical protein
MKKLIIKILLSWLALFAFSGVLKAQDFKKLIIVGNNTALKEIDVKTAQSIFRGKEQMWANREQVIIVLPSSKSDFADVVASEIFQMTITGMQRYWLSLVFQGRANSPVFLNTAKEMITWVKENPGSICAIPAEYINEIPTGLLIRIKE